MAKNAGIQYPMGLKRMTKVMEIFK